MILNDNQLEYPAFTPRNLSLSTISGYNEKDHDKYLYVVHKIIQTHTFNKGLFQDYVQLNSRVLKKMLTTRKYYRIINELTQSNVIEANKSYSTGKFSKSYRIAKQYRESAIKIELITNKPLLKKIYKINSDRKKELLAIDYYRQIHTSILEIKIKDFRATMKELEHLYSTSEIDIKQYNSYFMTLNALYSMDKNNMIFTTDQTNRLHHNLTNFPSRLRKALTWKTSEDIISTDLRNSHPFIFCKLILNYYQGKVKSEHIGEAVKPYNTTNVIFANTEKSNHTNTHEPTPYVFTFSELPKDVQQYIELTSEGKFYEYVMNKLNIPANERKEFKLQFFGKIFYSKSNQHEEQKHFKEWFPNVWRVIKFYKRNSYKDLPIRLMKEESNIFITKICSDLFRIDRELNFIPVHDSILCEIQNIDLVRSVVERNVYDYIGIKPTLSTEIWN